MLQLSLNELDVPSPVVESQPEPVPTPKPPEPEKPPEPQKPPEPVALPPPPVPAAKPKPKPVAEKVKTAPAAQQVSPSASTTDATVAEAEHATAAAAAAAQAQSRQSSDLLDAYRGRVNAAIQAAVNCPLAAQNMGMSGQTKVHFDLKDGVQSNAVVAVTSKRPMLDSAALSAVQSAHYPAPPKEFAGQLKTMSVLVVLNCAS